jgi:hypothetical protein
MEVRNGSYVARAVNFLGIIIGDYLSFSNDEEGFHNLLLWIQNLQNTHHLSAAVVGMEPTGHYWLNVSRWLTEHHFEVVYSIRISSKRTKKIGTIRPQRVTERMHSLSPTWSRTVTTRKHARLPKPSRIYVCFSLIVTSS